MYSLTNVRSCVEQLCRYKVVFSGTECNAFFFLCVDAENSSMKIECVKRKAQLKRVEMWIGMYFVLAWISTWARNFRLCRMSRTHRTSISQISSFDSIHLSERARKLNVISARVNVLVIFCPTLILSFTDLFLFSRFFVLHMAVNTVCTCNPFDRNNWKRQRIWPEFCPYLWQFPFCLCQLDHTD